MAIANHKLYKFESAKCHPDNKSINIGNSHILVINMGRIGCGAYNLVAQQLVRVTGLDSNPIKVEQLQAAGLSLFTTITIVSVRALHKTLSCKLKRQTRYKTLTLLN